MLLFQLEAVALAATGGMAGLLLGYAIGRLLHALLPALPVHTHWNFALLAEVLSVTIGLAAGILLARRAAGIVPNEALRTE